MLISLKKPWLRGYRLHIPVLSVLCPQLNLLKPARTKFLGTPLQWTDGNDIFLRMCNCCWCGKRICSTYSECVFLALSNKHPKRIRCIILSCIPFKILAYFSTLFHKRYLSNKICFLNSSTNLFCKVSYSKKNSHIYCAKDTFLFM